MLGLLLDAAVIIGIIYLVNQGDQMDFGPAVFSALVIAIGNFACLYLLGETLGIFALAPMFGIAILAIWMISGLPLGKAAIAGVIFMVYKVGFVVALSAMMS